jgi:phenylacetate-CoA ligase
VFFDDVRRLEAIRGRIADELRNETLVTPRVELLQPNSLPTTEGKAVRVADKRNKSEE